MREGVVFLSLVNLCHSDALFTPPTYFGVPFLYNSHLPTKYSNQNKTLMMWRRRRV